MPKANKHAEVKPSKYRTALCEFYLRQEECPFGTRCAFAHGEHELQTEERNVELLKATGLQRLDAAIFPTPTRCSAMTAESSLNAVFPVTSLSRRHPVIVSLPCWTESRVVGFERSEPTTPGKRLDEREAAPSFSFPAREVHRARCSSRFSATCSTEAPVMYRHNPYAISTHYE
ncbi:putative zinc finger (CCCH type) protein [Trypanosoma cruzi]|uniref:C3H1-type domain-containing protein n=2 Tax=Trypanosoma cruzi TaxID=5693 RepID=Q4DEN6_TRYCC|nr:hypothetical protein, conserved [Trypanosoma cruzi]EAN90997.1 hypothetical protein, conserved [Trypanosoma cruzi]PWV03529.1 putative zinc finger (CCCH type) protein [Trypanosoma cruzi]|eukprot:XP_812848.1 hypothetical protein [Trypanosoma cruzi strain CL Brener]